MADLPEDLIVLRGPRARIAYARNASGEQPARDFLEDECSIRDKARIYRLFQRMAEEGRIRNREQFKQVDRKIFEFKAYQVRLSAFQDGDIWFLGHGFIKKQNRWPPSEIVRAIRIRNEHLAWWSLRERDS